MKTYKLDPDCHAFWKYKRNIGSDRTPYCSECFRTVDPAKAKAVTVSEDGFSCTLGGSNFIGSNCWKKILRRNL